MKKTVVFLITLYQQLSPVRGYCRFYPTCSEYTKKAIEKYGLMYGLWAGLKRLIRCQPFGRPGIDVVSEGRSVWK
jgi:putative membrane protein insertion efficiency factor